MECTLHEEEAHTSLENLTTKNFWTILALGRADFLNEIDTNTYVFPPTSSKECIQCPFSMILAQRTRRAGHSLHSLDSIINLLYKAEAWRSDLSTWKCQFSYDHLSQARLNLVNTWMGDSSSGSVLIYTGFPDSTRRGNKWKRGRNDEFKMH